MGRDVAGGRLVTDGGHVVDPTGRPYDQRAVPAKPTVGIEPLLALDVRVGRVVDVAPFPEARKPSWQLVVDLGPVLGERRASAQLTTYSRQELVGRQVVCATNLGTRRIAGFESEVLVLAALEADGTPRLLVPDREVPTGSVVA